MKLTKQSVDKLPAPAAGYSLHFDDELPSFGVRVTASGVKAYVLDRRINGRSRRMTICRAEHMAPDAARNQAKKLIGQIIEGKDPVAKKQRERADGVTVAEIRVAYLASRELKPRTRRDYQVCLDRYLADWLRKPITRITPDMVARKHRQIGERSKAQANLVMRYLHALFAFARLTHRDGNDAPIIASNPVDRLTETKARFRIERRRTVIKPHEITAWFAAVNTLPENARDCLLFSLFTGLRPGESATLRVAGVDLKGRTFTVTDTKVHRDHTLPLADYTRDILTRRIAATPNEYVFPGLHGKGHIKALDSAIRLVTVASGVAFCRNDLRRTFITVAESLDIPAYALKRLLNHSVSGDVTAGYIVTDVERLRAPMQKIEDFILKAAEQRKSARVVNMKAR